MGALYGYALGQLVVKAFQKAGAVDREKFINAMEGLIVDSPVGKLEMRKCDHQLMLPMFFGVTKKSPELRLPDRRRPHNDLGEGLPA